MKKLNCILLVDDNESTNYLNRMVINEVGCSKKVHSANSAEDAIEYLELCVNEEYPKPDIIFLDINMPGMDGWDFLDEFSKIDYIDISDIKIIMLSTSSRTEDIEKAKKNVFVDNYTIKPLNYDNLVDLIEEHFN